MAVATRVWLPRSKPVGTVTTTENAPVPSVTNEPSLRGVELMMTSPGSYGLNPEPVSTTSVPAGSGTVDDEPAMTPTGFGFDGGSGGADVATLSDGGDAGPVPTAFTARTV